MGIKKNFFAPLALGLGATRRVAMLLLVMMLTTATAWATDKTLSGSESYTAQDGDVLTGSTSGTVTIAADAKIMLSDVTITGGIVCAGTAEITLVGTNSVTGSSGYDPNIDAVRYTAGIQVGGSGTTLTIKGDGSLTANGALHSAGIGLSRAWGVDATGGDIVIEGGNITATGDGKGAGIGTGVCFGGDSDKTATLGNITIKGGTVRAISGTDNSYPGNGIGKGGAYNSGHAVVGTITIYDGIDLVDASSISESIVYMHETTDVTESKADYFTITEDGSRRVIFPKDDTDYTITIADGIEHGTIACEATTAKLGANVTITATPDQGYIFSRLVVKDAQNNDVESTGNSFTMPRSNVSVSAIFAEGSYNGTCGNGVYYAYDSSTNTLTISGTGAMMDYYDLSERPWDSYASDIQKVVIGAGVTSIGMHAFLNCLNLTTVTVYAPSCTLGDLAFANCNNLANIYVFSDLVYDYKATWTYAEKITGITGGYCGTTDHERDVVWALTGKSPNCTLTISGTGAMYNYDEYITPAPWNSYAEQIKEFVIENGVTSICKYAFYGTRLTSIEIPASVTSIGENAFRGCTNLGSVTFAEGSQLESIGKLAFNGTALTSIEIPASVTSIGENVFLSCNSLASMAVEDGNTVYDSRNGCNAIIEKSTNTLIFGCKNSTIPAGVTSIGESAFSGTGLTSIEIPASVTSIGDGAFASSDLTSITIPASVTSIGRCAFLNCLNLATVTVYAPSCSLGEDAFANCNNLANIYVFGDKVASYKAATNWSAYTEKITALPTVTTSYVDADGTLHEGVQAVPLNNAMTTLSAGWYVVNSDINYTGTITLNGDVNIILADGKTMSVVPTTAGYGIFGYNDINGEFYNLTIYGQTGQSGTLTATTSGVADPKGWDGTPGYAIYVGGYTQQGGIVTLNTSGGIATCISADADVTITRGTLTANTTATYSYGISVMGTLTISGGSVTANATGDSDSYGISVLNKADRDGEWFFVPSTLTFSGGNVEASSIYMQEDDDGGTINLSWTNATDRFKVTEYVNGTITIADGKTFHNGSEPLSGTVTDKTKLNGKTLTPPTYSVTANRATKEDTEYWSTFYHPAAGYTADENTTVYQAAVNTTTNKVELTAVPGREIPADKAVVLKSTQSAITLSRATTTQTLDGNELKGGATVADGTVPYTLAAKDGTVGFYKFVGAALNPNKAHLEITAPAQSAPAFLGFEENTTAINEHELHESHELSGAWYSLDGRKLSGKPSAKGIYVRNGRKFIIK